LFDNIITFDSIGTNFNGTVAVPNGGNGVLVNGVDSNKRGLTASHNLIAGNVISGNGNDGVLIQANANGIATGNLVSGNFIGTNAAGTAALANGAPGSLGQTGNSGVEIVSASGNTVGGTGQQYLFSAGPFDGNLISGNAANGVHIIGTLTGPANTNAVVGNFVGVDVVNRAPLGNGRFGIEVSGARATTVGGEVPGYRNVVGGNMAGIVLDNGAQHNLVANNRVGVSSDLLTPLGNTLQGIVVRSNDGAAPPLGPGQPNEPGTQNNQIGGTVPGDGNTVAYNGSSGVAVFGNPVATNGDQNSGNTIEGNSIYLNGRGGGTPPRWAST
jgi:parallel beta-helix repeat protein